MSRIGFIGLGLMGSAMAARLASAGHPMVVLGNRNRKGVERLLALGAGEAAAAQDLAAGSDVVMLCMGSSEQVEGRVFGPDGVLEGVRPGALVVDFGTSRPESSQRIAAELAGRGAGFLDAAMARTPAHAEEGKLNLIVGGSAEDYARALPLFQVLAENIFHIGPVGAGHTLKLLNNFFAMTTATAMAEVFAMADKAGLKRQAVYDVLAAGPNRSAMMDFIKAWAVDGEVKLAFSIGNAAKDLGYYADMARALGHQGSVSAGTAEALNAARDAGWGGRLVPEMVDFLARART